MEQNKNAVGQNLRWHREKWGFTYATLSKELRKRGIIISPQRLKRIEEQTGPVWVNDLVIFAQFYGVKIKDFFDE